MRISQSIAERFLDEGPLSSEHRKVKHAARSLSTEISSLKDERYLQDQLDVFNILCSFPTLTSTLDNLNLGEHEYSPLHNDIEGKYFYLDIGRGFWDMVRADLPWQLRTRASIHDTEIGTNPPALRIEAQILCRHPKYEGAVFVRDPNLTENLQGSFSPSHPR